jgi:hypothetical protein
MSGISSPWISASILSIQLIQSRSTQRTTVSSLCRSCLRASNRLGWTVSEDLERSSVTKISSDQPGLGRNEAWREESRGAASRRQLRALYPCSAVSGSCSMSRSSM